MNISTLGTWNQKRSKELTLFFPRNRVTLHLMQTIFMYNFRFFFIEFLLGFSNKQAHTRMAYKNLPSKSHFSQKPKLHMVFLASPFLENPKEGFNVKHHYTTANLYRQRKDHYKLNELQNFVDDEIFIRDFLGAQISMLGSHIFGF